MSGRGRRRFVVIGGDAAGATAASTAKRGDPDLEVVVLERSSTTSYSACGIPYWVAGDVADRDSLIARSPGAHRRNGLDVRIGTEAVAIDTATRVVTTNTGEGIEYDELLVATGGQPRRPNIPGIERAFGVQTLDDGEALIEKLDWMSGSAVVAGGGYIGLEMSEALVRRGFRTVLVDRSRYVMTTLDPELSDQVRSALEGSGVDVRVETELLAIDAGRVKTSGGPIDADVVVLGIGSGPAVALGAAAGLSLGGGGALAVDDRGRTPVAGVWAAGDCADVWHRVARRRVSIQLGTVANKTGRVAGLNIGGGHARFGGVVGTAVSKICHYEVARTGLSSSECESYGIDFAVAQIESTTRAGYMPGSRPITVRLLGDRATGRVVGGQIIGVEGAAKRIDVIATALWNEMLVADMVDLDLSYAPPFAGVWDPVLIAARALVSEL